MVSYLLGVNDDFTWSVWVNLDNISANALILEVAPVEPQLSKFTKLTPTKLNSITTVATRSYTTTINRPMDASQSSKWSTLTYYANGESIASAETTQDMDANPFYIGGDRVFAIP